MPGKKNQKEPSDILKFLPEETIFNITGFLDIKSIIQMSGVSKSWYLFFRAKNIWIDKIIEISQISRREFLQAVKKIPNNNALNMRLICLRLARLKAYQTSRQHYLEVLFKREYFFLLLICCIDDPKLIQKMIAKEEHCLWVEISLFAGCLQFPLWYIEQNDFIFDKFIIIAAKANNFTVVKYALSEIKQNNKALRKNNYPSNTEELLEDVLLSCAAKHGNEEAIYYFIRSGVRFNSGLLESAIFSGNLSLVKRLLKDFSSLTLYDRMLIAAVDSGNADLFHFLVVNCNLKPTENIFNYAWELKQTLIVNFLQEAPYNFCLRQPNNKASCTTLDKLKKQTLVGNLELIKAQITTLTNTELKSYFDWVETRVDLRPALLKFFIETKRIPFCQKKISLALETDLSVINYFIGPRNKFAWQPSNDIFESSLLKGNHILFSYLIDPSNQFNFPDKPQAHTPNPFIQYHLLPAWRCFKFGLYNLKNDCLETANKNLQASLHYSINHFSLQFEYVLAYPEVYQLTEKMQKKLIIIFKDLLKSYRREDDYLVNDNEYFLLNKMSHEIERAECRLKNSSPSCRLS